MLLTNDKIEFLHKAMKNSELLDFNALNMTSSNEITLSSLKIKSIILLYEFNKNPEIREKKDEISEAINFTKDPVLAGKLELELVELYFIHSEMTHYECEKFYEFTKGK